MIHTCSSRGATFNGYALTVETLCSWAGIPRPVAEFKFHDTRRWRFDFCWPDARVALEVEGGAWTRGRHTRGTGYIGDLAKYNAATVMGYRVLRYTPEQLASGDWTKDVSDLIARKD